MPRYVLRAFPRLMLLVILIGQIPPAVPMRPVAARSLPPPVTVAAKPAEAAQATILSTPIESKPAPVPITPPASIRALAPVGQMPHTGDVELLLPTRNAPAGQGGVWHYKPGNGWSRIVVTDGTVTPDNWYWCCGATISTMLFSSAPVVSPAGTAWPRHSGIPRMPGRTGSRSICRWTI